MRNLDKWLVSMFHNPHSLVSEKCCFKCFLKREQQSSAGFDGNTPLINYITNKPVNYTDIGRTIFEIRYSKIKSYFRYYKEKHKNIIFVSLDHIQDKNNCYNFINKINQRYNLGIRNIISEITHHCKTNKKNTKNIQYNTQISEDDKKIIDRYKNDDIEKWVDNLTFEMS